jgi:hypothetical protein
VAAGAAAGGGAADGADATTTARPEGGTTSWRPARSIELTRMPLASASALMLTPYSFAMPASVSPEPTRWLRSAG